MAKKKRADILAAQQGLAENADKASRMIMAGEVLRLFESGESALVQKPGDMLPDDAVLSLKEKSPFVSRGAFKLLTGLEYFKLDVSGLVALDAGASTGGFTDCLLQRGAARVYAVDVGTAQLHEKLLRDARVVSLEGVNLRLAKADLLPEKVDLLVGDLSFISLKAVLPVCMQFLKPGAKIMTLIKPQFEVETGQTVKGVVRNEALRQAAVQGVLDFARAELGLEFMGVIPSAIKGPKGNQEYMAYWQVPVRGKD